MRKPKHWQPERDFAFSAETFTLAGESYREACAIIARDEREGERAVQLDWTEKEAGK